MHKITERESWKIAGINIEHTAYRAAPHPAAWRALSLCNSSPSRFNSLLSFVARWSRFIGLWYTQNHLSVARLLIHANKSEQFDAACVRGLVSWSHIDKWVRAVLPWKGHFIQGITSMHSEQWLIWRGTGANHKVDKQCYLASHVGAAFSICMWWCEERKHHLWQKHSAQLFFSLLLSGIIEAAR